MTVIVAVTITYLLPHIFEWLGFEHKPLFVMEKQETLKVKNATYERKNFNKGNLSPRLIVGVKSKCAGCGFDFEPWKDDATHDISHGLCTKCYLYTIEGTPLKVNMELFNKLKKREIVAERWMSV